MSNTACRPVTKSFLETISRWVSPTRSSLSQSVHHPRAALSGPSGPSSVCLSPTVSTRHVSLLRFCWVSVAAPGVFHRMTVRHAVCPGGCARLRAARPVVSEWRVRGCRFGILFPRVLWEDSISMTSRHVGRLGRSRVAVWFAFPSSVSNLFYFSVLQGLSPWVSAMSQAASAHLLFLQAAYLVRGWLLWRWGQCALARLQLSLWSPHPRAPAPVLGAQKSRQAVGAWPGRPSVCHYFSFISIFPCAFYRLREFAHFFSHMCHVVFKPSLESFVLFCFVFIREQQNSTRGPPSFLLAYLSHCTGVRLLHQCGDTRLNT